jgi:hypothetical protein
MGMKLEEYFHGFHSSQSKGRPCGIGVFTRVTAQIGKANGSKLSPLAAD